MRNEEERQAKETYVAPRLRVIELVTDEVLSANCKNDTAGYGFDSCNGLPQCPSDGS